MTTGGSPDQNLKILKIFIFDQIFAEPQVAPKVVSRSFRHLLARITMSFDLFHYIIVVLTDSGHFQNFGFLSHLLIVYIALSVVHDPGGGISAILPPHQNHVGKGVFIGYSTC
jgi:hypothetical protein